jgi:4,5-DOPA dioxygenase extradiol
MNVIEDNEWSRGFAELRGAVGRPRAIVAVSAHWFIDGVCLTEGAHPRTIHDFSGFPAPLYEIEYPAAGDDDLARRVRQLLGPERVSLSRDWGLDHGTWSVLRWMFPGADVSVVQLSIDRRLDVRSHYELGRALAALRSDGVLILGSGNVVHNLRDAFQRRQSSVTETPDWARSFDEDVKEIVLQRDTNALLSLWPDSALGRRAHPSPDHWLPLIYAYAAANDGDCVQFSSEGFDWGSISMRNIIFG